MKLINTFLFLFVLSLLVFIGKVYFPVVQEIFLYKSYQDLDAKIMRQKDAQYNVTQDPDVFERMLMEKQNMERV